jgi:hypothetical protein
VKGLTTEDTEGTEKRAKKHPRQFRVSKDLDRLLRIYEVSIYSEGPGGYFQGTLQDLIVEAAILDAEEESRLKAEEDSGELKEGGK